MIRSKHERRWLQFSLRSVLLLTLAVAVWLGYEVRQARHVERTLAALRALGGDAECEPTGWSLLRLCRVPGYGQRIVRAEIPGAAVDEATGLLRDSPGLREVQVTYDGTYDPTASWKCIRAALSHVVVVPHAAEDAEPYDDLMFDENLGLTEAGFLQWKASSFARRLTRVRAKLVEAHPHAIACIEFCLPDSYLGIFKRTQYRPLLLPDGGLAELFICEDGSGPFEGRHFNDCFVALIVEDKCVHVRGFYSRLTTDLTPRQHVVLEDLDHDGSLEVGFDGGAWGSDKRRRKLSGDARNWLGVYKIERDGFKSLLPEDNSDFP
jgi:hypothetical protein